MKNGRTLRLAREVLTELNGTELSAVVGASHLCGVTDTCTHGASFDSCPTIPVNVCTTIIDVQETLLCL